MKKKVLLVFGIILAIGITFAYVEIFVKGTILGIDVNSLGFLGSDIFIFPAFIILYLFLGFMIIKFFQANVEKSESASKKNEKPFQRKFIELDLNY